jgi:hypothetical protein
MMERIRGLYGKRTCADVCDQLMRKLKAAGYAIDNKDKSHADVMAALETCILPKATVRDLKLRDALDAAMTEMEDIAKHTGTNIETFISWKQCQAAMAEEPAKVEVEVVLGLLGGIVQDTWAFTDGVRADAKQAQLDKVYGIVRDAEGFVEGENNNQVITYVLELNSEEPSDKEASFMAVEGMGPASDAFTPMTEDEGTIEKSVDTLLFGQGEDQA